jgi:hypothetical protein
MKRLGIVLSLAGVFGFSLARAAVDTKGEKKADQTKASYVQKAEGEIQEWTEKLKSLQERSEKSGVKTREELDRRLSEVKHHLDVARKNLDELHSSGESAWTTLQKSLEEALGKVKRDYQKALSYFNKSEKKLGKGEKEK